MFLISANRGVLLPASTTFFAPHEEGGEGLFRRRCLPPLLTASSPSARLPSFGRELETRASRLVGVIEFKYGDFGPKKRSPPGAAEAGGSLTASSLWVRFRFE
ncbi:hypothetical protein L596_005665 [Steinernema carpocapsae]|uniref:Uncharacterized protein n=1 Tax=Steinernema carpocapsae TaxID=34508 RepID=A0A4U8UZS0_STECR|nr:hypothetical protein L596_005665 [Steinernema carpocapsae]